MYWYCNYIIIFVSVPLSTKSVKARNFKNLSAFSGGLIKMSNFDFMQFNGL